MSRISACLIVMMFMLSGGLARAAAPAPGGQSYTVTVSVSGVRSDQGQVLVELCADAATFMRGCATYSRSAAAVQGGMSIAVSGVVPGTYALIVIHDLNGNGSYDYPADGYGYGNNVPYPPTFEGAAIKVSGDMTEQVKLNYLAGGTQSQAVAMPKFDAAVVRTIVHDKGLDAELYVPKHEGKLPAMIVMGGSEGGIDSARWMGAPLTDQGYAVMILAYFRDGTLPQSLSQIPLEYFKTALDWLRARPEIDESRVGLWGASKGAEAVLTIASHYHGIKAVVASMPSDVVWQALDFRPGIPHSSWTFRGKDLPFVPFDASIPYSPTAALIDLHLRSLANAPDHDAAIIRVENIDGAILLLSGTDDHVWPSTAMADRVMKRLDAHHFRFAHEHLRYEGAGHTCCAGQLFRAGADSSSIVWFGGTPDVNAKARADSWTKILEFLKANLQQ